MLQGLKEWRNASNGFKVIRLHFSADPARRGPDWKQRMRPGYTQVAWDQEQDIVFTTHAGKGIYRKEFINMPATEGGHLVYSIDLDPRRPIYCIWDFGYHHPAVLFVQEALAGHHVVFDELMGTDLWLQDFIPQVNEKIDSYKGKYNGHIQNFCDPAGKAEKSTGESDLTILLSNKIRPVYRQFEIKPTIDYVRNGLTVRRQSDNLPILLVDADRCPTLVDGFNGGYRFPKVRASGEKRREKELPLEDGYYEHLHDDLRYYAGHRMRIVVRSRGGVTHVDETRSKRNPTQEEVNGAAASHPRFGGTQRRTDLHAGDLRGEARYPAGLRFNKGEEGHPEKKSIGGVHRRQIRIRTGYSGPVYSGRP